MILEGHYTHASDVWALGIIAWELYTSFTIGQDRQELSLPFHDLQTEEVNVMAARDGCTQCIPINFAITIGRFSHH